ncbi:MAG: 16S rRNA methyltransferase G [Epulopiscium sp. Nuni2H_MBin001]|nr:MAG: 16S rRNA methyltransferase G [Epulopiscium sp. Nuni2H_MBin001]
MLETGAKQLNIMLTNKQVDQLLLYKDILIEWNKKINLTAITKEEEIITKHFLDSMTVNNAINIKNINTVIDIGTGAGFPGMVLKIVFEDLQITLVDSLKKRVVFLEEVIKELGLKNIYCVQARAEDLAQDKNYREKFDIATSRAVANLSTLSEYVLPFVKVGGYFIALKGQKLDEELKLGDKSIKLLGGEIAGVIEANVPLAELNHTILVVKKIASTNKKYPRKAGEPSKNPLGKN